MTAKKPKKPIGRDKPIMQRHSASKRLDRHAVRLNTLESDNVALRSSIENLRTRIERLEKRVTREDCE